MNTALSADSLFYNFHILYFITFKVIVREHRSGIFYLKIKAFKNDLAFLVVVRRMNVAELGDSITP